MKKEIKDYFLIFGNDPDDPEYWERDYVELWQIILGIALSPFMGIGWIISKILGLKIK